jgi:hypothetical protein
MATSKSFSMLSLCHSPAVSCIAGVLTFLKSRAAIGEINTEGRDDDSAKRCSEFFLKIHAENFIKGSLVHSIAKINSEI